MYERLLDKQIAPTMEELEAYCGDGGWIHCRVLNREHLQDVPQVLNAKCG